MPTTITTNQTRNNCNYCNDMHWQQSTIALLKTENGTPVTPIPPHHANPTIIDSYHPPIIYPGKASMAKMDSSSGLI
jgi:hypothetical protein